MPLLFHGVDIVLAAASSPLLSACPINDCPVLPQSLDVIGSTLTYGSIVLICLDA